MSSFEKGDLEPIEKNLRWFLKKSQSNVQNSQLVKKMILK
jgi:hypothetical protein